MTNSYYIRNLIICSAVMLFFSATLFSVGNALETDSGGSPSFNVITLPAEGSILDNISYVSIIELGDKYNVNILNDPIMLSMTLQRGNDSLTFVNQSSIAVYNNESVNIVFPARMILGTMFVPVHTILPLFSNLINGSISWDDKNKRIDVSGIINNIENIYFDERDNGTIIGIIIKEPLNITHELTDENWLHIVFKNETCDPDSVFSNLSAEKKGIIEEIRLSQNNGETRFSFKVSDAMEKYDVSKSTELGEIQISLRHKRIIEPQEPMTAIPVIPPPLELSEDLWTIDTVVIDPGHGGKDPGTVAPDGTYEKDIVLTVAKELKRIIDERKEFKALLTRDRDVFIPLRERAAIADSANGKLFISIHVNGHKNKSASGLEAYFLSEARTEEAQRVADRENASALFEDNPEYYSEESNIFLKIFSDMQSNVFLKESQYMCQLLLDKTSSSTKQKSRGVKQGVYYVLRGTQAVMPSVLFEIGYISNTEEGKLIKRVSNQKRVAQSIYDAIIAFKKQAERDLK
ncbi:N-acetylmuramoyl-L-alanine amidase [Candidatus Latescibacterota bacterium]